MENRENAFSYTYSAREQEEVKQIREKYMPQQEDKMEQLRRLDRSATQKAQAWSIGLGVVGALVMGLGMSLAMTNLGEVLGSIAMPLGVVIGVAGMVPVALAYPMYSRILKKERERIAPEILRLTEELMK